MNKRLIKRNSEGHNSERRKMTADGNPKMELSVNEGKYW